MTALMSRYYLLSTYELILPCLNAFDEMKLNAKIQKLNLVLIPDSL